MFIQNFYIFKLKWNFIIRIYNNFLKLSFVYAYLSKISYNDYVFK